MEVKSWYESLEQEQEIVSAEALSLMDFDQKLCVMGRYFKFYQHFKITKDIATLIYQCSRDTLMDFWTKKVNIQEMNCIINNNNGLCNRCSEKRTEHHFLSTNVLVDEVIDMMTSTSSYCSTCHDALYILFWGYRRMPYKT